MITPDFLAMPPELCRVPRWVVHKRKVPYRATALNSKASSTDSSSWSSFDQAQTAYEEGGYDGVGFVLNADGIVGIDLDKCCHGGSPVPAAMNLMERIGARYIEVSPSGTGLRGFGYGDNIGGKRGQVDGLNVEMYATGRYLTVTGHPISGGPLVRLPGFSEVAMALNASTYRGDRGNGSHSSVSSVSSVLLCRYPTNTLPGHAGQRNYCLFELVRFVKAKYPTATRQELSEIVRGWHELVSPVIETKDFSVTLFDFLRGWEKVRQPHGEIMNSIVASIDATPLPPGIEAQGYGARGNHLVKLCVALQAHHDPKPFFISARQAGEQIGVHFTDAATMLAVLCSDGVLTLVSKGVGRLASRYRFSWNARGSHGS